MNPKTLADFSGDYKPSGGQLNFQNCPVCGNHSWKLYVDPQTGAWFCFGGGHHKGGKVDVGIDDAAPGQVLLDMLEGRDLFPTWEETELPPWEPLSRSALRYLGSRGLAAWECKELGLVEWTDKGRVLIPYFKDGELIFWTSRRYSEVYGDGPKYLSQPGAKPLYVVPPVRSPALVIVEGVFDAIRVRQSGSDAIALGGKSLPAYHVRNVLTMAKDYGIIYVLLDEDALADALRIQDQLSARTRTLVCVVPIEGDPADKPKHELRSLLP